MTTYPTFCCICNKTVNAELVDGGRIYPNIKKLHSQNYYRCPHCYGYVGINSFTKKPLGKIVSKEIKRYRMAIHSALDPLWFPNEQKRCWVYREMSKRLGYEYHTANVCSEKEARLVLNTLIEVARRQ